MFCIIGNRYYSQHYYLHIFHHFYRHRHRKRVPAVVVVKHNTNDNLLMSGGRWTRLFFFIFLHFSALASVHIVSFPAYILQRISCLVSCLTTSDNSKHSPISWSRCCASWSFWSFSFHVCKSQKCDHIQLFYEIVSAHYRYY